MSITFQPVVRAQSVKYKGAALVGTYSVIIGWDLKDPSNRIGLKGFAIRRSELNPITEEVTELRWLRGYKRFKSDDSDHGEEVSSLEAPFQRFRWNDYSLKPENAYRFEVFEMRGDPGALVRSHKAISFLIRPSREDQDDLGIYVNRGVTAASAYLSRFKNKAPKEVGAAAYNWLSRGLKESLLEFIESTENDEALHIAIYEFHDPEVAQAVRDAVDRGVTVQMVHDAKPGKHSTEKNEKMIHDFQLEEISFPRTNVNISHNKVVIRLSNNVPKAVWTGSANFSENAFNFQTNTALVIRDPQVAVNYEAFFQGMKDNPLKKDSKIINLNLVTQANVLQDRFAEKTFFSPVRKKDLLATARELVSSAKSIVMVSAPFGLDKTIIESLGQNSGKIIEYGLVNATAKRKIEKLHRKNTRFFTPSRLKTYMGKNWDAKAFGAHKIHAKSIVVDPWGDDPKVLIGSANFSNASCSDNDENALLIVGNKRLASIIASEFMRMYDHYKSRYYIDRFNKKNEEIEKENKQRVLNGLEPKPLRVMDVFLKEDEEWSRTSFDPNTSSHKFQDRIIFAGAES